MGFLYCWPLLQLLLCINDCFNNKPNDCSCTNKQFQLKFQLKPSQSSGEKNKHNCSVLLLKRSQRILKSVCFTMCKDFTPLTSRPLLAQWVLVSVTFLISFRVTVIPSHYFQHVRLQSESEYQTHLCPATFPLHLHQLFAFHASGLGLAAR